MYDQPFNPFAKNLTTVKEYFKTPATLAIGICQIVGTVLSLAATILISTKSKEVLAYIRSYASFICDEVKANAYERSQILKLVNSAKASDVSVSVLSSIPAVLIAILTATAFFIVFFKCRDAEPNSSPMTGFTILYVFAVISLVVTILATVGVVALFVLLFLVYSMMASGSNEGLIIDLRRELRNLPFIDDFFNGDPKNATIFLIVVISLLVVALVAIFYALFTAISRLRYYKSVRNSLSSVELQNKGAKAYGVMCIFGTIGTGCSLLSMVSLLFPTHLENQQNPFVGFAIILMLSLAASFVASLMEAKLALGYKKHIDNVKYGYNTPSAPAAPAAPAPSYAPFKPAPGAPQQNNPYVRRSGFPKPIIGFGDAPDLQTDNAYSDPFGADSRATEKLDAIVKEIEEEESPAPSAESAAVPTCPRCGEEVDPNAPFCGNCGNRL